MLKTVKFERAVAFRHHIFSSRSYNQWRPIYIFKAHNFFDDPPQWRIWGEGWRKDCPSLGEFPPYEFCTIYLRSSYWLCEQKKKCIKTKIIIDIYFVHTLKSPLPISSCRPFRSASHPYLHMIYSIYFYCTNKVDTMLCTQSVNSDYFRTNNYNIIYNYVAKINLMEVSL